MAAPKIAWQHWQRPLARLLDRCVPASTDVQAQLRERVLAGYVLLQTVVGSVASLFMLTSDWPWDSRWRAGLICSGQSVVNLLLLYALKRGAPRAYVIHGVVAICYVTFTVATLVTGGLHATAIPLLLLLVAAFAFCLGGQRPGLFWSAAVLATVPLVDVTTLQDSTIVQFSAANRRELNTIVYVATVTMLCAVLSVYEQIYGRYGRQITRERHNYYAQAHTDPLTGLPNRRAFEQALRDKLAGAALPGERVTLIYIDLDGFKGINDRFGHDVGDVLLQAVARRIESCLRAVDVGARLGGDEFGVIVTGLVSDEQTDRLIDRLRGALAAPVVHDGDTLPFGASLGYATWPTEAADAATLVQAADRRMYREKQAHHEHSDYVI